MTVGAHTIYSSDNTCFGCTITDLFFDGITEISSYAFYSSLSSRTNRISNIHLPNGLSSIGSEAFRSCGVNSVFIQNETPIGIDENTFGTRTNETLFVPEGCKAAYEAADYWKDFNIVEMPAPSPTIEFADANVKAICVANWDANGDGELSEAEAAAVTELGDVFKDNNEITSFDELRYFTGLTELPAWGSFDGCTALKSITIPANVTSIDGSSFANCTSIEQISVDLANTKYESPADCNAIIEKTPDRLVVGCETTQIPEGITAIGSSSFWGRWGMQRMDIPQTVTTIEGCAFAYCISLSTITLPASVNAIGDEAFSNCNALTSVYCYIETPPAITEDVFTNRANATLHVPYGCKAAYKAADYWKDFNIVEMSNPESTIIPWGTEQAWEMKYVYFDEIGNEPGTDGTGHTWTDAEFDDSSWATLTGPIARNENDFSVVNTIWEKENSCYYLRRTFNLDEVNEQGYYFCSHHDDNIKVWINGTQVVDAGYNGRCQYHHIPASAFVKGTNTMAIYLDDTGGGAYLDYCMANLIDENVDMINIVKNSNLEGTDVSCFYSKEDLTLDEPILPATIVNGAGKDGSRGIVITSIDNPSAGWDTQLFLRLPQTLSAGTMYRMTFDYKASQEASGYTQAQAEPGDPIWDGIGDMNYTTAWQHFEKTGIITEEQSPADHMRTIAFMLAEIPTATTYCFDNIVFEVDQFHCATEEQVSLSKTEIAVQKGKTVTLVPTVYPTSLSDKSVTWKSSKPSVATVTGDGKVKGVGGGTATITCTSVATGSSAACTVTVGKVSLSKSEVAVQKGNAVKLTATVYPTSLSDKSVTWKSSNTSVATVSGTGRIVGVGGGTATISCTSSQGFVATCKVTVGKVSLNKSEVAVQKGNTVTLAATVYPTSLSDKSVTWKSSNTSVATVTSDGKVTGVGGGTATVTCTSSQGFSATCIVTVGKVSLNKTEVAVQKGNAVKLTATVYPTSLSDKSVTWNSSNTSVATVSSTGRIVGVGGGTATITCTSSQGFSATCIVTVGKVSLNKTEVTVQKGNTVTLTGTVYPTFLPDRSVTWKSSNTSVATVTSDGKVTGVGKGTATVTCTSSQGFSATCEVTVTASNGSRSHSSEGDEYDVTGIDNLNEDPAATEPFDVYDLRGNKVLHRVTSLDGLPDGIYIVNGKKILKKK